MKGNLDALFKGEGKKGCTRQLKCMLTF